jgi:large subunit ribosomal protein L22
MSSRKIRAMSKYMAGKIINKIMPILSIQKTAAAKVFEKLLYHIISNINKSNLTVSNFFVKQVNIDQGPSRKKIFTRSQGRVNYIKKRTSHVTLLIDSLC